MVNQVHLLASNVSQTGLQLMTNWNHGKDYFYLLFVHRKENMKVMVNQVHLLI